MLDRRLSLYVAVALIILVLAVSITGEPAVGFALIIGTLFVTLTVLAIREVKLCKKEQAGQSE